MENIKRRQPQVSGLYKIKTTGIFQNIKQAYYSTDANTWTYDDGFWLPVCLDAYITHWKETR